MKTLLLTGGTGYIGSHNAVLFLQEGYDVIILDNLSNSDKTVIEKIEEVVKMNPPVIHLTKGEDEAKQSRGILSFYEGDLRNIADIEQVFSENTIDGVIHFAGAKAVGESCEKPFYYYENNVVGTMNLCKVMEKYDCRNLIFSSSANVYGPEGISPFNENHQVGKTSNPYGTTKFIIERLLRDLHYHSGFNVINLRYFNPVGAHESGLIGEHANQKLGNILPFLLRVANNEQEYIKIFGDDYDTPDGTGIRDYIHVVDLAQGHLAAAQYLETHAGVYENINLGTGKGTSVLELLKTVRSVTGHDVPHKIVGRREIDIATAYCNAEKSEKLLQWKAKKTITEAVADSWNFIQKGNKQEIDL